MKVSGTSTGRTSHTDNDIWWWTDEVNDEIVAKEGVK